MLHTVNMCQVSGRGGRQLRSSLHTGFITLLILTAASAVQVMGQSAGNPAGTAAPAGSAPAAGQPVGITLAEAIQRAEASVPAFAAARAASQSAALNRSIARAGLLPTARYFGQGIYTQPNGTFTDGGEGVASPNPRFVANDSRPREYIAQGIVDETLSLGGLAAVHRADAAAAMARAQLEISRRGLVAAVTSLFYGSLAADHKVAIAQCAYKDAANFTSITSKREKLGDAAYADVVKAQLTEQQQWRALQDARLAAETARLDLGVLLFRNPMTPYTLKVQSAPPSPTSFADVEQAAAKNNPDLKSALAALDVSNADVLAARGAYLPTLGLTLNYGIDANEFAVNGPLTPDGVKARNLGYSTTWTVSFPIWDWLATQHKVKQSEIQRQVARVALNATQRQLIAQLQTDYSAVQTAWSELASLDTSVKTAADSLRLSELRYQGGEALVIEVVDAQNAYVTAENAREDGRVRYENALAQLQTLTGTM